MTISNHNYIEGQRTCDRPINSLIEQADQRKDKGRKTTLATQRGRT